MDGTTSTPGPWTVRERIDLTEIEIEVIGADGATLATSSEGADAPKSVARMRAELRMMAAAPDLLALVRELRDELGTYLDALDTSPEAEILMERARAAIARTEGR